MTRTICIHGHFYQPPRENPWLEAIEVQDSAYPYHDWNERINAECYAPNASARILDGESRIVNITNNYAQMSFDFGPTLLSWLEKNAPDVYESILEADRQSQKSFSGHGSAIALAYNHMILPLASTRDKRTQILWGIRDFKHRFHRDPEGMWLPETAVDIETLDILAENGIRFTILAPHQAKRYRKIGEEAWKDVRVDQFDYRKPYQCSLPSGRSIAIFFYNGPISRAVAFEGVLRNGEAFANKLTKEFLDEKHPQIVHIATDGETYGHHHRHGDMALAYALRYVQENKMASITNYGEFLEQHPPEDEVEVITDSSWSCAHGVERWRSDCGCNTGGGQRFRQDWRGPLREALDFLRDGIVDLFPARAALLYADPWKARDDYISVILDRSDESISKFFEENIQKELNDREKVEALQLMEMMRNAMLMYTSCGWFFDDISGIESVQILQYAGRAIQLAEIVFEKPFESAYLERLSKAKSNLPDMGDGRKIYERFVLPARTDLRKVAAHYAALSTLEEKFTAERIYCYQIDIEASQLWKSGRMRLSAGKVDVTSALTRKSGKMMFALLHLGDHNIHGGVRPSRGDDAYMTMLDELGLAFQKADIPGIIRVMDRHLGESVYSLKSLFHDEQRKVLHTILESTLKQIEGVYRNLYEQHASLMRFFIDLRVPLPKAFQTTAEFMLNLDLKRALEEEHIPLDRIAQLLTQAREEQIVLDRAGLGFAFQVALERVVREWEEQPQDTSYLATLKRALELIAGLPLEVNLWRVQNRFFALLQTSFPKVHQKALRGDSQAEEWVKFFQVVGEKLHVRTPE